MANLAIQGHATRGNEVIALLEMLGGVAAATKGFRESYCYYISEDTAIKYISWDYIGSEEIEKYKIFTLEEFLEKYPFKVGDKVNSPCKGCIKTITSMEWDTYQNTVTYKLDNRIYTNIDQLNVVNDLQPYKEETMGEIYINKIGFNSDKVKLILPNEYEFKVEGDEIFVVKKKFKYPKTYEECCGVLGMTFDYPDIRMVSNNEFNLYSRFIVLIRCRNAYWKIAGEEMGLDKPWKSDFTNNDEERYGIYTLANKVERDFCGVGDVNMVLSFPTEEMRDAFYENFKDLIEQCKELL